MSLTPTSYSAKLQAIGFSGLRNKSRQSVLKLAQDLLTQIKTKAVKRTTPRIGALYHFTYDAKFKDTLPYWDKMPVTMPISIYDDGFLGINFHYLHPYLRAKLLDRLQESYKAIGKNEAKRLQVSYSILNAASGIPEFRPCIKRYLATNLKSPLLEIPASQWFTAVVLPLARFQGAPMAKVYSDSRKAARK
jgi:hypothetical protein